MKNFPEYITFLTLIFTQLQVSAQKNIAHYQDSIFKENADHNIHQYTNSKPYYIGQWQKSIPGQFKIIKKIDKRIAIIKVNSKNEFDLLKQNIKISPANNSWKFPPGFEKIISKKNKIDQKYILTGLSIDSLLLMLSSHSKELTILNIDKLSNSVVVKCNPKYLEEYILPSKDVIFLDEYVEPKTEIGIIGYDRSFHGINAVDYAVPGANGKGIVIGVKEQKMEEGDLDLWKRVFPSSIAAGNVTNHATVIASIIGGAGNSFYNGRGIAYGSKFFPSSFANLFVDDTAILNQNKVSVQNHSYGTIIQQFYGAEAVSYDASTWLNKNFVHVFSAGNQGDSVIAEGRYSNIPGYANLTGNFKMSKNIITVGAIDNKGNIPSQSSAGPLYDGRIAPQLIALGPNGTSDAAAVVTGAVAVMQQVFADSNSNILPPSSLIKAILYNTADDIHSAGIDYKTGYGLLNCFAAVKAIQQKKYDGGTIVHNQVWLKDIIVPDNAAQLKITLAWTDSASTVNNNKAIMNDLDLEVQNLNDGTIYQPWVLNAFPNVDSLKKSPVRKRDSLNTAEQISIQLPVAGSYQVKVTGKDVPSSTVPFYIAHNIDTLNTFYFLNPLHASDVNRAENESLDIKWKTFVADSNQTGILFVSYNNGISWNVLQTVKLYTNQYTWEIKDTNSIGTLKMETSFGIFFSKDFVISKVIETRVDFVCTDSFQLSWDRHIYANAYKIYALTDSPYLKPVVTVSDTFKVFKRIDYPSLVYAVEPLLNNNLTAARSVAINIELQGVNCFYRALNYNLLDDNNLNLILEISGEKNVDSIYFEKVSSAGQLQQVYGSAKAIGNSLTYNQLVNNLASGMTFFRARIKLKGGGIVYTDVISVLTSGLHQIVFYPNPVTANVQLNYVLKQGISADSRLQLFDFTGRLIKDFPSLPDKINVAAFPSGILIYKLFSQDSHVLDTGKIIIIRK